MRPDKVSLYCARFKRRARSSGKNPGGGGGHAPNAHLGGNETGISDLAPLSAEKPCGCRPLVSSSDRPSVQRRVARLLELSWNRFRDGAPRATRKVERPPGCQEIDRELKIGLLVALEKRSLFLTR